MSQNRIDNQEKEDWLLLKMTPEFQAVAKSIRRHNKKVLRGLQRPVKLLARAASKAIDQIIVRAITESEKIETSVM